MNSKGSQKPLVFFYVKKIYLKYLTFLYITYATEVVRVSKIFFKLLAVYSRELTRWLYQNKLFGVGGPCTGSKKTTLI